MIYSRILRYHGNGNFGNQIMNSLYKPIGPAVRHTCNNMFCPYLLCKSWRNIRHSSVVYIKLEGGHSLFPPAFSPLRSTGHSPFVQSHIPVWMPFFFCSPGHLLSSFDVFSIEDLCGGYGNRKCLFYELFCLFFPVPIRRKRRTKNVLLFYLERQENLFFKPLKR